MVHDDENLLGLELEVLWDFEEIPLALEHFASQNGDDFRELLYEKLVVGVDRKKRLAFGLDFDLEDVEKYLQDANRLKFVLF